MVARLVTSLRGSLRLLDGPVISAGAALIGKVVPTSRWGSLGGEGATRDRRGGMARITSAVIPIIKSAENLAEQARDVLQLHR